MLGIFSVDLISFWVNFLFLPTFCFTFSSFAVEVKTNSRCTMIFLKLTQASKEFKWRWLISRHCQDQAQPSVHLRENNITQGIHKFSRNSNGHGSLKNCQDLHYLVSTGNSEAAPFPDPPSRTSSDGSPLSKKAW